MVRYIEERFGSWQVGNDQASGAVEFKIYFPNTTKFSAADSFFKANVDVNGTTIEGLNVRYDKSDQYGDPEIDSIQVVGDFQASLGNTNWDTVSAPSMTKSSYTNPDTGVEEGTQWSYQTPTPLAAGFYEYQYFVTYTNGETRFVSDPCARYGGSRNRAAVDPEPRNNINSGIVVGGSSSTVSPVAGGRQNLRNLRVYEINLDNFTDEFRGVRAPLDAVVDKLDYIRDLGFNAVLPMPWTAWPGTAFNWGYEPFLYFAVSYRYANDLNTPAEKLSYLKQFVNECHIRGIHVIMDGVFNHVTGNGLFPYHQFYRQLQDTSLKVMDPLSSDPFAVGGSSPYVGPFDGRFSGLTDLDFNNACVEEFVRDVCFYWMDEFGIDGIRFDNTVNFYDSSLSPKGLPNLVQSVNTRAADPNFATILEHLEFDAAVVTNDVGATSYWNNAFYGVSRNYLLENQPVSASIMNALDSKKGLIGDKVATTYLTNHDHAHLAWYAGAKQDQGSNLWFRTQPLAIAFMMSPGSPMIQNGQEFAEDHWLVENDVAGRRVQPRPLRWSFANDDIGKKLRDVYTRLNQIRNNFEGLRSDNISPVNWPAGQSTFNTEGYGVDSARGLVIFHRYGETAAGVLQRFIIVLNFSPNDQVVSVPFSIDGLWEDLLSDETLTVSGFRSDVLVSSNWGRIYFIQ